MDVLPGSVASVPTCIRRCCRARREAVDKGPRPSVRKRVQTMRMRLFIDFQNLLDAL